jgi:hypothetical protein
MAGGVLAAVAVATAGAVVAADAAFERRVEREVADLFAGADPTRPSTVDEAALAALPAPIQRWLRRAGVVGRERPVTVRLRQSGQFRMWEDGAWMPFTAEEYYTTDPPGFVWAARMRVAPLLSFTAIDRYRAGHGRMDGRLLSIVPVAGGTGPELDQGALLRYLNETMWFPAAVISPFITWEAIDDSRARATMTYADVSASAVFVIDAAGDLTTMTADRYASVDGGYALQPWSTPITGYGTFDGVRLASDGVGVWSRASGDFAYIRLHVDAVEVNRAARWGA